MPHPGSSIARLSYATSPTQTRKRGYINLPGINVKRDVSPALVDQLPLRTTRASADTARDRALA